jgi:hypothetical protein
MKPKPKPKQRDGHALDAKTRKAAGPMGRRKRQDPKSARKKGGKQDWRRSEES